MTEKQLLFVPPVHCVLDFGIFLICEHGSCLHSWCRCDKLSFLVVSFSFYFFVVEILGFFHTWRRRWRRGWSSRTGARRVSPSTLYIVTRGLLRFNIGIFLLIDAVGFFVSFHLLLQLLDVCQRHGQGIWVGFNFFLEPLDNFLHGPEHKSKHNELGHGIADNKDCVEFIVRNGRKKRNRLHKTLNHEHHAENARNLQHFEPVIFGDVQDQFLG
mmetsp:Transcript_10617/g.15328  ORF Transcript_10617/g.15328 Transcript_10617/m.15328 type:complete len:214 (-) Transcript_10617:3290-3931(-)